MMYLSSEIWLLLFSDVKSVHINAFGPAKNSGAEAMCLFQVVKMNAVLTLSGRNAFVEVEK